MGQKTNPNIFRLGRGKEWKSRYIEKKSTELSTVVFRDLEIKKFIFQLFAKNALTVHNYRLYYSESALQIYISYYSSFNRTITPKKIKFKYTKSFFDKKKTLNLKKKEIKNQLYTKKAYLNSFSQQLKTKLLKHYYFLNKKTPRLETINSIKMCNEERKTLQNKKTNLFISKILKSLNHFTNGKHHIYLHLKQVNTETTFLRIVPEKNKKNLKRTMSPFRRFQENEFFDKGSNILNLSTINHHSSEFIAKFIAIYLKKLKRPNFFLRFLKKILTNLLNRKVSKFRRIQIKIKGRFNGAPRSRSRFISIGRNIPNSTINSNINYGEATAYTKNGTFGIKVWTYGRFEKKKKHYVKCAKKNKI